MGDKYTFRLSDNDTYRKYVLLEYSDMKISLFLCFSSILFSSCIDRINIKVPDSYSSQLVVDGLVTDEQGPYTIKLSKATRVEKFLLLNTEVVSNARITISDNAGTSEILTEMEPGTYQTKVSGIHGVVGRSYSVKIETKDGRIFESIPDTMSPVGELDDLYYEFESYLPLNDQTRYGFRIYIDASGVPDMDNLVRWKFTAVAEVDADPKLHVYDSKGCSPDPPICSGWISGEFGLQKVSENCTCCTCWVTRYEDKPHVSDNRFVSNGKAKRIEVGYIPLEYFPFLKGKYRAEVKQMSLSKEAFAYWQLILSQKDGAASLFQPPTGKIRSNLFEKNGDGQVLGFFYASAIKTKQLYLGHEDVKVKFSRIPIWDCEKGIIAESCLLAFPNSSNQPPADWK